MTKSQEDFVNRVANSIDPELKEFTMSMKEQIILIIAHSSQSSYAKGYDYFLKQSSTDSINYDSYGKTCENMFSICTRWFLTRIDVNFADRVSTSNQEWVDFVNMNGLNDDQKVANYKKILDAYIKIISVN